MRPIYSTWFFDALSSSETTYWSDKLSAALLLGVKYQKVLGKKIIHSHDRQRKLSIAMINNSGTKESTKFIHLHVWVITRVISADHRRFEILDYVEVAGGGLGGWVLC